MEQEKTHNEIVNATINEWDKDDEQVGMLPSRFQLNESVTVFLMPESEETFPGLKAKIRGVHFYPGKVKYDVELEFAGDYTSRIYNVDSVLVHPPK